MQLAILALVILLRLALACPDPICVVGGGLTGLRLAKLLQDKGQEVALFEAKATFGGKMETYRDEKENIVMEKGPLIFTPGEVRFRALLKEYGLKEDKSGFQKRLVFDPVTGATAKNPTLTPQQIRKLQAALAKYTLLREERLPLLLNGYTNPGVEESDLTMPSLTWIKHHKLEPLLPFMEHLETAGHGRMDKLPTLYLLRIFDPALVRPTDVALESEFYTTKEGFDKLIQGMASEIAVKSTNAEVVKIDRSSPDSVKLFFKGKDADEDADAEPVDCAKVILTFAPLLSNLNSIIRDLTQEEEEILKQIKVTKYASAGAIIPNWEKLDAKGFQGTLDSKTGKLTSPIGEGEPSVILRTPKSTREDIFTVRCLIKGPADEGPTEADLQVMSSKLKALLENIGKAEDDDDDGDRGDDDDAVENVFFGPEGYDHCPRVNGDSIKDGFYRDFKALQGKGGVYYATTLLTFDLIEQMLEMVEGFVTEYF